MVFREVKKTLIDQGLTIEDLSKMTGYSRGHLSGVINGRHKSTKVMKVIALALKKSPADLWNN